MSRNTSMPNRPPIAAWVFLGAVAVAFLVTAVSCGQTSDIEDVDVSGDDSASQEQTICGRSWEKDIYPFFDAYCLRCHSEKVQGALREGTPEDLNYDTQDEVIGDAAEIRASLLDNAGMPPSPPYPTAIDRDDIIAWLDCAMLVAP